MDRGPRSFGSPPAGVDLEYLVPATLVQPFLDSVAVPLRAQFSAMLDLEQRLVDLCAEGENQWPELKVPRIAFVAFVGDRLPTNRSAAEALTAIRAGDLYLTCACANGSAEAIRTFDKHYVREINLALARMRTTPVQVDEVKQLVRQKLFVSDKGSTGKIVAYSGRGDLRRWVRSIAVRTFLNLLRKNPHEVLPDPDRQVFNRMSSDDDDPELAYMKERYRNEFRNAFLQGLRALDDRQQNLLRYHHVDGLNIDEIGAIYRVHRVTAYRWLEKARNALVNKTRKILMEQLKVEKREFESIMRMIRSQLHLSLVRYLGDVAPKDNEPESES